MFDTEAPNKMTEHEADEIICYSVLMGYPLWLAAVALGYTWNPDNFRFVFLRRRAMMIAAEAREHDQSNGR